MTTTDVMDLSLDAGAATGVAEELAAVRAELRRVADGVDGLNRRLERLEELPADLWPMVEGLSHTVTHTLARLEADGTLALVADGARLAGRVATGAARALTDEDGARPTGLIHHLRDPDVRRGMALMLAVLGELGQNPTTPSPAVRAGRTQRRIP